MDRRVIFERSTKLAEEARPQQTCHTVSASACACRIQGVNMAEPDICFETDDEECDGLLDLADALGDVLQEPQPQQAIPVAGGAPTQTASASLLASQRRHGNIVGM